MWKILVIGTGGTISCTKGKNGLAPAASIEELLQNIDIPVKCEVTTEQLFNLDSTNMTPRHWERLAMYIRDRYDEFDGFVITHGTDTMAYAVASLSVLIQNSHKPIAFTGSMKPMGAADSDARENLRDAFIFVTTDNMFGVRLVFSGVIYNPWDVSKKSTFKMPFGIEEPGAIFYDDCFNINESFYENFSYNSLQFYERLSDDVFHAKLIPGQRLYIPESARAVVLESYGEGGVPDYLLDDIAKLRERGVYVIIASQCSFASTDLNKYEVGRVAAKKYSLLETGERSVEYAVARARWALEYSNDFESFKKMFYED